MERALMSLSGFLEGVGHGGLDVIYIDHIFCCVFSALDHLHSCTDAEGCSAATIHYDLKPENVLVFPAAASGSPVELDFKITGFGSSLLISTLDPLGIYVRVACMPSRNYGVVTMSELCCAWCCASFVLVLLTSFHTRLAHPTIKPMTHC